MIWAVPVFGLGILSISSEIRDHNHKEGLFALRKKKWKLWKFSRILRIRARKDVFVQLSFNGEGVVLLVYVSWMFSILIFNISVHISWSAFPWEDFYNLS